MSTPSPLAEYIRQVRDDEPGLTLEAIARRAGLPLATVGAWATGARGGNRPPSVERLKALAKGLRRPESEVFQAAGRAYPQAAESARAQRWAALERDLTDEDVAILEAQVRAYRRQRGI